MDRVSLKERLLEAVHPYHLDDLEIEEYVESLHRHPERVQEKVLEMAACIWPVSHALTFQFLNRVERGLAVLGEGKLSIWVGAALDSYEEGGLDEARLVLADGGRALLAFINGEVGLRFQDVSGRLLPYLCGLAERTLDLEPADRPATDTSTVFLPPRIRSFKDNDLNFILYKYALSIQWGHIHGGTYRAELPPGHPLVRNPKERYGQKWKETESWLESFFLLYPKPALARELYQIAETLRVASLLGRELPGLARDAGPVLSGLRKEWKPSAAEGTLLRFLEEIRLMALGPPRASLPDEADRALAPLRKAGATCRESLGAVAALYRLTEGMDPGTASPSRLPFEGELRPAEAERARRKRRAELHDEFVEALAVFLGEEEGSVRAKPAVEESGNGEASAERGVTAAAKRDGAAGPERPEPLRFLKVGGRDLELPENLRRMAREIEEDLGHVPESYVSGALSAAGRARGDVPAPPTEEGPPVKEPVRYDEWDFRRSGFRKNWCALHELEMEREDHSFVPETLRRYRGPLGKIRRYFELMRTSERFLRRQREGEDIDIDAVTEALADLRAGRPSSDRLFVRLVRDTRDIATLFLVDMSSSTEGWVNGAIKESLVLLCEALSILGDRYAIYGFSGMKRLRSEFYHIKHFEEPYDRQVKGRIAAIRPMDYTRMGPPIRHARQILKGTESKVRLLVTLSDGRPEDYDDYRGEYSIEDTRHALIETKSEGIHPFCITIDKEARSYIPHMYGEVNYIVIDDVRKLPLRMPEIYRTLTT